jgi:hypothetical protein
LSKFANKGFRTTVKGRFAFSGLRQFYSAQRVYVAVLPKAKRNAPSTVPGRAMCATPHQQGTLQGHRMFGAVRLTELLPQRMTPQQSIAHPLLYLPWIYSEMIVRSSRRQLCTTCRHRS